MRPFYVSTSSWIHEAISDQPFVFLRTPIDKLYFGHMNQRKAILTHRWTFIDWRLLTFETGLYHLSNKPQFSRSYHRSSWYFMITGLERIHCTPSSILLRSSWYAQKRTVKRLRTLPKDAFFLRGSHWSIKPKQIESERVRLYPVVLCLLVLVESNKNQRVLRSINPFPVSNCDRSSLKLDITTDLSSLLM